MIDAVSVVTADWMVASPSLERSVNCVAIVCVSVYILGGLFIGVSSLSSMLVLLLSELAFSKWLHSFGTFDGGGELMHTAWQKINHVFAIRRSGESCPLPSGPKVVNGCPNFPRALLDQHHVDLLVIE